LTPGVRAASEKEPVVDHASTTWVGLDAHKKFIQVAMRRPGEELEDWRVPYTAKDVQKLARKLTRKAPGEVRCCYEAGPVGFTLQRRLEATNGRAGLSCVVIAPTLIPKKPRQLMSYLGLTPSEHSSAGNTKRGGITKLGLRSRGVEAPRGRRP